MRAAIWIGLLALCLPGAARAEWLEASSAHFVVYADDSERDIRQFSQQLERYHAALGVVTSARLPKPSPSNRLTVYFVRDEREVRRLYGSGSRYLGAFYLPRAGSSLAIVPRVTPGTTDLGFSMVALLHEYAHHYMIAASTFPMQRWYSEGGAEFLASARFPKTGGVTIGAPAQHRAAELLAPGFARDVTVGELIDPPKTRKGGGYDSFYGKSWLLFHYLTFEESRRGQMTRYLKLLGEGKPSREAGVTAFGDLAILETELDAYLRRRRMTVLELPANLLAPEAVAIRRLTAGEAAIMPIRVRSKLGVDEDEAKALLPQARAVAARFPDDPAVLAALAEAEFDAGDSAAALVAADAALARDPARVDAHVQKCLALYAMAAEAKEAAPAYRRARVAMQALNRLESDHPLPLIYYYRSFVDEGLRPSELAFAGLARAVELAPFDLGLRMTLATSLIERGRLAEARFHLAPIAYHPHGGELAEAGQRLIARMDADPKWDGRGADALVTAVAAPEGE